MCLIDFQFLNEEAAGDRPKARRSPLLPVNYKRRSGQCRIAACRRLLVNQEQGTFWHNISMPEDGVPFLIHETGMGPRWLNLSRSASTGASKASRPAPGHF